jgi:hypothetical protein
VEVAFPHRASKKQHQLKAVAMRVSGPFDGEPLCCRPKLWATGILASEIDHSLGQNGFETRLSGLCWLN